VSTSVPAIEGWFTTNDEPALLGGRCTACRTFTFPHRDGICPNPHCSGQDIARVELSRRGIVWSYATNHYAPPPPAVVQAPYTVVAVTLQREQLTVLGLLSEDASVGDVKVGAAVELRVQELFTDESGVTQTIWKWCPVAQPVAAVAGSQVAR
jgi:uncharacterized OB-fold protein